MVTAQQANKISKIGKNLSIKRKLYSAKIKILIAILKGESTVVLNIPANLNVDIILDYFKNKEYKTEIKYC